LRRTSLKKHSDILLASWHLLQQKMSQLLSRHSHAFPNVKIAIRGGGHTPNPNHNNVEAGLTFDLRRLNHMQQPKERKDFLEVGSGRDWDAVHELLESSEKPVVGS
jgi:hypothetical protein